MSIPLYCKTCGEVIGSESVMATMGRGARMNFDSSIDVDCPGNGKHKQPIVTKSTRLFGLIVIVNMVYPETDTSFTWKTYSGPSNLGALWFAIVFGTKNHPNGTCRGLTVNGKEAYWDRKLGFYGDGIAELGKLQST